jgi:hypothetical protein
MCERENSWPYEDQNSDPLGRPTRSQSLNRLSYPSSHRYHYTILFWIAVLLAADRHEFRRSFQLQRHFHKPFCCKLFRTAVVTSWISYTIPKCDPLRRCFTAGKWWVAHGRHLVCEVFRDQDRVWGKKIPWRKELKVKSIYCVARSTCRGRIMVSHNESALSHVPEHGDNNFCAWQSDQVAVTLCKLYAST